MPVKAEIVRVPAERAASGGRRRLLVADWPKGTERMPVLVISLHPLGCRLMNAPPGLEGGTGRCWLKLPDHEAIEIAQLQEGNGEAACGFLHELPAAIVEEIANPPRSAFHQTRFTPRCTFLRT